MKRLVYAPKINAYIKADSGIYDISEYIVDFNIDRKINQVSTAELTIRNPYKKWTNHTYRDSITGENKVGPIFHPMDPITIFLQRLQNRPVQVFTGFCDQTPYLQLFPGTVPIKASCTLKKLQYTYFDAGLPFMREFLEQNGWFPNEDGSIVKPEAEQINNGKHTAEETNKGVRFGDSGIGGLLFNVLNEIGGWPEDTIYIQEMPASVINLVSNLFELFKKEDEQASKELTELLKKIVGTAELSAGSSEESKGKSPIIMFDSVDLSQIPKDAEAVAGYVDGQWPTFSDLVFKWPEAHRLSIAVSASSDAECLDIETGDATPAQAPAWVRRQIKKGVEKPVVYSSVSVMDEVISELQAAGISRNEVRVWTAHYTNNHLCGPGTCKEMSASADATQWTNNALGKSLDQSVLTKGFFS